MKWNNFISWMLCKQSIPLVSCVNSLQAHNRAQVWSIYTISQHQRPCFQHYLSDTVPSCLLCHSYRTFIVLILFHSIPIILMVQSHSLAGTYKTRFLIGSVCALSCKHKIVFCIDTRGFLPSLGADICVTLETKQNFC